MFSTILGEFLHEVVFPFGVMLSSDELCNDDGGSLVLPYKNIGEAGTGGVVCTKFTADDNIYFIAQISASWNVPMFFK